MFTLADGIYRPRTTVLWTYTRPGRVVFTVSGAIITPTAGAVYSDSINNFTIISASIAAGVGTLVATGAADPAAAPGTLTKVSGTGDATIAYSAVNIPNAISLTLPPGTTRAVVKSSGNATVKMSAVSLQTLTPLTTWPQPVFSAATSGGDEFRWEPDPSATPHLRFITSGDSVLEAVVYVNSKVAASTTITEAFTVSS